jgi:hypothetical protein
VTDTKLIKAYTVDASGELKPLATDSIVLEFPSGKCLEIEWDTIAGEPSPLSARVWGGRRSPMTESEAELEKFKCQISQIGILPAASNLIRFFPFSPGEND